MAAPRWLDPRDDSVLTTVLRILGRRLRHSQQHLIVVGTNGRTRT